VWVQGYDVGCSGVEDSDFHVPEDGCTFDEMTRYGGAWVRSVLRNWMLFLE